MVSMAGFNLPSNHATLKYLGINVVIQLERWKTALGVDKHSKGQWHGRRHLTTAESSSSEAGLDKGNVLGRFVAGDDSRFYERMQQRRPSEPFFQYVGRNVCTTNIPGMVGLGASASRESWFFD
jgi:hypothetical protein